MDQTFDEQMAQGILTVEKTTTTLPDGKQVPAVKTVTIREPLEQTLPLEDLQRRLGEFQAQKVDLDNQMEQVDYLIDYYTKVIAAVSKSQSK